MAVSWFFAVLLCFGLEQFGLLLVFVDKNEVVTIEQSTYRSL